MPDDTTNNPNTAPTQREPEKDSGLTATQKPSAPPVGGPSSKSNTSSPPAKTPDATPSALDSSPTPVPETKDSETLSDPLANAYEYDDAPRTTPQKEPAPAVETKEADIPKATVAVSPEQVTPKPEMEAVPEIDKPEPTAPPVSAKVTSQTQPIGAGAIIKRSGGHIGKIIIWAVVIIAIIAVAFYLLFYRATIVINPTPAPDTITLDGKNVNPGTYRVNPGRHKLVIKKTGYVSYVIDRNFKMAQKDNLNFTFEKQPKGTLISASGSNIALSSNKEFIVFIGNDGKLYSQKLEDKTTPQAISTATYKGVRELLVSEDSKFALILDNDGLKIVDFLRQDLVNQTETKLPPLASAIDYVTWNASKDGYYPEANSHIIYDMKTDYSWDLILANRQHSQSEILMEIEKERFDNIYLNWGKNQKQVLVSGGELGVIDLASRSYTEILKDKNIVSADWSPQATRFAARSQDGKIYGPKDQSAVELGVEGDLYRFTSENELFIIGDGRPTLYNFDTGQVINYAEVDGLSSCQSFEVIGQTIYFADNDGIKSAVLELPKY